MRGRLRTSSRVLAAVALLVAATPSVLAQGTAVQVGTAPYEDASVTIQKFPVLAANGTVVGSKTWRVVNETGNCCENYLASTHDGRLVNFGGTYIRFTDDFGKTWRSVQTPVPYVAGEGAIAAGPDGDVIGIGWAAYTGDQLWAHKYDASQDAWFYQPIPNHQPFYDRPWISVLPGPFEYQGEEVPFVAFVMSGFVARPMLMSADGLSYERVTWEGEASLGDAGEFDPEPHPANDWIQPHATSGIASIGSGWGISTGYDRGSCERGTLFTPQAEWACGGVTEGVPYVFGDAAGTLHRVSMGTDEFSYEASPDGPGNWNEVPVDLPDGLTVEEWDAAAQASSDQAVVAIHAHDRTSDTDVDLVYRFDRINCDPRLEEVLQVGRGDMNLDEGALSERPRFDFSSVAILPGGRLAVSFADSVHHRGPGVAIEMGSFPDEVEPAVVDGGCPPEAGFAVVPNPVATGTPVEFTAGESQDPDGSIEAYRWSFGDGANATGDRVEHAYEAAGTYNVTLTVVDDDGHEATARKAVEVLDPGALEQNREQNAPPTARFSLTGEGLTLEVDASNSSDVDGEIATYRWDWGDGNTSRGTTANHTYAQPGTYTIQLVVEDASGATAKASTEVNVRSSGAPETSDDDSPIPGPGVASLIVAGLAAWVLGARSRRP